MKTISKLLFTSLVLLGAALLYADDLKVMVSQFESKTNDNELTKKVAIACSDEVMRSKGFIYVSPTDYIKAIIGDEKVVKKDFVDLEKEYSVKNLDEINEMCKPYQGTMENFSKAFKTADVVIGGNVERKGNLVKIESTIANMKNQRYYSIVTECEESHLSDEIRKTTKKLLEKISKIDKIYADKLADPEWSKVIYVVKTVDNKDIKIEVDYTGDRPNPQIQNVSIMPSEGINKNDITVLNVKSEENKIIEISYNYKLGKLESVKVDTPIPDSSKSTEQSQTLTLKSNAGYLLEFSFIWNNGLMTSAKISPKVNPFGDIE